MEEQILSFNEDLSGLKTDRLLHSLKILKDELSKTNQGEVDLESVRPVAEQLASTKLLAHKDPGVRIYLASCLADILRIYAPNAPYSTKRLEHIFDLFTSEFDNIGKGDYLYVSEVHGLLEDLVEMQCISLVADLPSSQHKIQSIFGLFLQIVTRKGVTNSMEYLLGSILSQLIAHVDTLPPDTTKLILSQFKAAAATSKRQGEVESVQGNSIISLVNRQFSMIKLVCQDNIDIMTKVVNQYFAGVLSRHSLSNDDDAENNDSDTKLQMCGDIIIEIWKSIPEILVNVIGQLDYALVAEQDSLRSMATRVIGTIIGHEPSTVNFINEYPQVWKVWLKRSRDKSLEIRLQWIDVLPNVLAYRGDEAVKNVMASFLPLFSDHNESIRVASCEILGNVDLVTTAKLNDNGYNVVDILAERLRDRKHSVRSAAFETIGDLYDEGYDNNLSHQQLPILDAIPCHIMEQIYINDNDVNESITLTLSEKIFPIEMDDRKRSYRLLSALYSMNSSAETAFYSYLCQRQMVLANALSRFVEFVTSLGSLGPDDQNRPKLESNIQAILSWLAGQLAKPEKSRSDLSEFLTMCDKSLLDKIQFCVSPLSSYSEVVDTIKSILELLRPPLRHTMKVILLRSSYLIFNRSCIPSILNISRDTTNHLHGTSHSLLKAVTDAQPILMQSQGVELFSIIENSEPGDKGLPDTLKTACILLKKLPQLSPGSTKPIISALNRIILKGDIHEAKEGTQLLLALGKDSAVQTLPDILQGFGGSNSKISEIPNAASKLSALSQYFLSAPDILSSDSERVCNQVLAELLGGGEFSNIIKQDPSEPENEVSDDINQETLLKIMGIQLLVNRVRGGDVQSSRKTVPILVKLIINNGVVSSNQPMENSQLPHLRLAAGLQFLKLARCTMNSTGTDDVLSTKDVCLLVKLVQDHCFEVRSQFVRKLTKYLTRKSITVKYLPLIYFLAFEPEKDLIQYAAIWLQARYIKQRGTESTVMEDSTSRFLHILSHQEKIFVKGSQGDFDVTSEVLITIATYVLNFISLVVTEENLSIVFYMMQRVKQHLDHLVSDSDEENSSLKSRPLYLVSDVAQLCLLRVQDHRQWSLLSWPGKRDLPKDAFVPITSTKVAQMVAKTTYIPEELSPELEAYLKRNVPRYCSFSGGSVASAASATRALAASTLNHHEGSSSKVKTESRLIEAGSQKGVLSRKRVNHKTSSHGGQTHKKHRKSLFDFEAVGDENMVDQENQSPELSLRRSSRAHNIVRYDDVGAEDDSDFDI